MNQLLMIAGQIHLHQKLS